MNMNNKFEKQILIDNIAFLVKEKGIKIGELETECGVSAGYISRISKEGGSAPGIEFVVRVANKLDISIDVLLNADLGKLTATERYLTSFLERLIKNTSEDQLIWERETENELNTLESDRDGEVYHPLFDYCTFTEPNEDFPQEMTEIRFNSHAFGVHTVIAGDCFKLFMQEKATLYIMNISKSVYLTGDDDAFAKEVWISVPGLLPQYLCGTKNVYPIGSLVNSLYNAIIENSNHPKVKAQVQEVIDAFMAGNHSDNDDFPF